jgi:hypothetical protein
MPAMSRQMSTVGGPRATRSSKASTQRSRPAGRLPWPRSTAEWEASWRCSSGGPRPQLARSLVGPGDAQPARPQTTAADLCSTWWAAPPAPWRPWGMQAPPGRKRRRPTYARPGGQPRPLPGGPGGCRPRPAANDGGRPMLDLVGSPARSLEALGDAGPGFAASARSGPLRSASPPPAPSPARDGRAIPTPDHRACPARQRQEDGATPGRRASAGNGSRPYQARWVTRSAPAPGPRRLRLRLRSATLRCPPRPCSSAYVLPGRRIDDHDQTVNPRV